MDEPKVIIEESHKPPSLLQDLLASFTYPFVGKGVVIIVVGTVLAAVLSMVPTILGFIVAILMCGYVCSYAASIVRTTADHDDTPPPWPDFSNVSDDILQPLLLIVVCVLACLGPYIATLIFEERLADNARLVQAVLLCAGLFLLPMALLSVMMYDSLAGLNPLTIGRAIFVTFPVYLLTVVLFMGANYSAIALRGLLAESSPLLAWVLDGGISLYFLLLTMRLLGVLYRRNAQKLGWFE